MVPSKRCRRILPRRRALDLIPRFPPETDAIYRTASAGLLSAPCARETFARGRSTDWPQELRHRSRARSKNSSGRGVACPVHASWRPAACNRSLRAGPWAFAVSQTRGGRRFQLETQKVLTGKESELLARLREQFKTGISFDQIWKQSSPRIRTVFKKL